MNVFDLMATLSLDRSAYNRGLNDAERDAQGFGSRLVGTLGGAAKAAGAALAAAGAGVAMIAKQALGEYANYEQLVGGVDTLFGESADKIMRNAEQAFATVGLSANQYMETVTSFSASLIQSTAGDTAAAADYADMALRDMADNANKMGTNMASIQNAYQGFAKQNYTMLDNLKLGYGGTKTEMIRLVEDAERLNSEFRAIRDENGDIALSYADVVEAIHIVQQQMGITGTTAAEAAGTITGSTAAVRAAWQNLLTGLGDETADIGKLVDNFTDTLLTNIGNMVPRVEKIIRGIGRASTKLIPKVLKEAIQIVNKMLPDFVSAAKSLVADIGTVIFENAPELIASAVTTIANLGTELGAALPTLIPALQQGFGAILSAFANNLPLLSEAAITIINGLADGMIAAIPIISEQIPVFVGQLADFIDNNVDSIVTAGVTLFTALIDNIDAIISAISEHVPTLINKLVNELTKKETIAGIIDGGVTLFTALIDNIDAIVSGIADSFPALLDGITDALDDPVVNEKIKNAGRTMFSHLTDDKPGILQNITNMFVDILTMFIRDDEIKERVRETAKNMVSWLFEGIKTALKNLFHPEEWPIVKLFSGKLDLAEESKKFKYTWDLFINGDPVPEGGLERVLNSKFDELVHNGFDVIDLTNMGTQVSETTTEGVLDGLAEGFDIVDLTDHANNLVSQSADIGTQMAQSLSASFRRTMAAEAASMNAAVAGATNGGSGGGRPGVHITQNVYATQMTPAQAFSASQQAAENAQYLAIA